MSNSDTNGRPYQCADTTVQVPGVHDAHASVQFICVNAEISAVLYKHTHTHTSGPAPPYRDMCRSVGPFGLVSEQREVTLVAASG